MVLFRIAAPLAALLLVSCNDPPADMRVSEGWARATAPGQTSAATYFSVRNQGRGPDRLVSVATPGGAQATLHRSSSEGGVARMRAVPDGIPIPAGATVELEPGGYHAMLTGLGRPLSPGETIELTVRFERSGSRALPVRIVEGSADGASGMSGMNH